MTLSRRHSQYGVSDELRRLEAKDAEEATKVRGTYEPDQNEIEALVKEVKENGWNVPSRYGDTIEVVCDGIIVPAGTMAARDGMNQTLGWMEMLQLLAGVYDLESLQRVAPKAEISLFTYDMAYGPRVVDQIPRLLEKLAADENTRQAIVFVAEPEDGMTSRLPCTLSFQFLLRRDILDMVVTMRSWDLCRGLPYDIMMFSGLLMAVARCLYVDAGNVTVRAGSCHIYEGWIDKCPTTSPRMWYFGEDAPRTWFGFREWAIQQIRTLEKGGTPSHLEFVDEEPRS